MRRLTSLAFGAMLSLAGAHAALSQESSVVDAIDACLLSDDAERALARFDAMDYRAPTGDQLDLAGSYFAYGQRVRAYIERGQMPIAERAQQELQLYRGAIEAFAIDGSLAKLLMHPSANDHFVLINTFPKSCGVVQYATSAEASVSDFGFGPDATLPRGLDAPVSGPLWSDMVITPTDDTLGAMLRRKVPQDGANQAFTPLYTISEWSLRY